MEKPDFFKMAIDRNLYLAAPEAAEMCEIVWNTHVVPLQKELAHEVNQREEYFEDAQILLDDKKKLESENKALREGLGTTEKALQEINNQHQEDYKRLKSALEEVERLKAELKNANSALDNISDMGHA